MQGTYIAFELLNEITFLKCVLMIECLLLIIVIITTLNITSFPNYNGYYRLFLSLINLIL